MGQVQATAAGRAVVFAHRRPEQRFASMRQRVRITLLKSGQAGFVRDGADNAFARGSRMFVQADARQGCWQQFRAVLDCAGQPPRSSVSAPGECHRCEALNYQSREARHEDPRHETHRGGDLVVSQQRLAEFAA